MEFSRHTRRLAFSYLIGNCLAVILKKPSRGHHHNFEPKQLIRINQVLPFCRKLARRNVTHTSILCNFSIHAMFAIVVLARGLTVGLFLVMAL